MYSSQSFSSLIPATPVTNTVHKPLLPSSVAAAAAGRRRRTQVKASVSTFTESIRLDSGKSAMSLYDILRVNPKASQVEIKTAYRSLAKIYHPDAMPNHHDDDQDHDDQSGGGDFIVIHDAYETLSDPEARAVYDLSLSAATMNYYRRAVGYSGRFYTTRRWETDQCW